MLKTEFCYFVTKKTKKTVHTELAVKAKQRIMISHFYTLM